MRGWGNGVLGQWVSGSVRQLVVGKCWEKMKGRRVEGSSDGRRG